MVRVGESPMENTGSLPDAHANAAGLIGGQQSTQRAIPRRRGRLGAKKRRHATTNIPHNQSDDRVHIRHPAPAELVDSDRGGGRKEAAMICTEFY